MQFLASHQDEAAILAGGTDILVQVKQKKRLPKYLVNIKGVSGLDGITYNGQGLRLGALTTIRTIETSPIIKEKYPVLAEAAATIGSVQVRNRGTLGGNLCNASPAADMAAPLIALGATARILGPQGERTVSMEEFFAGPGKTVLGPGEVLAEVAVPPPSPRSAGAYIKLGPRKAMDIAVVGVAAVVTLESQGDRCRDVRIALGSVAPIPLRAKKAETVLRGQVVSYDLAVTAGHKAMEEASPITDIRGSAEYRRDMVGVLTRRAVLRALEAART
ncbi:MAG: xanthine dehydrogenase family protein subunit M [Chloroflexi bacterium]|nr:xanthine dehydrogenase family protein subunit M [Chloroflexota bacterium]